MSLVCDRNGNLLKNGEVTRLDGSIFIWYLNLLNVHFWLKKCIDSIPNTVSISVAHVRYPEHLAMLSEYKKCGKINIDRCLLIIEERRYKSVESQLEIINSVTNLRTEVTFHGCFPEHFPKCPANIRYINKNLNLEQIGIIVEKTGFVRINPCQEYILDFLLSENFSGCITHAEVSGYQKTMKLLNSRFELKELSVAFVDIKYLQDIVNTIRNIPKVILVFANLTKDAVLNIDNLLQEHGPAYVEISGCDFDYTPELLESNYELKSFISNGNTTSYSAEQQYNMIMAKAEKNSNCTYARYARTKAIMP